MMMDSKEPKSLDLATSEASLSQALGSHSVATGRNQGVAAGREIQPPVALPVISLSDTQQSRPAKPSSLEATAPVGGTSRISFKQQMKVSLMVVALVFLAAALMYGASRIWDFGSNDPAANNFGIVEQDLEDTELIVDNPSTIDYQLSGEALVVQGDVVSNGKLKLYDGQHLATLIQGSPTTDRTYTLPDADGTFCLVGGDCGFVLSGQLDSLQEQVTAVAGQLSDDQSAGFALDEVVSSLTGTSGQIIASAASGDVVLSLPQNIGVAASPTFAGLTITGAVDTDTVATGGTVRLTAAGVLQSVTADASVLTSGTVAIARGGTGAATAQGAIDVLSGLTNSGDLLYHDGTNAVRLARGANGQCLTSNTTTLVWGTCGDANTVLQNGNTFGTSLTIGTNDNFGLNFEVDDDTVASFTNTGAALFKNASDSATAFQVQNTAGEAVLIADTAAKQLAVADVKPLTSSTTTDITTTVDSSGSVGPYTSITLGADGFARISYLDNTNADLKFARCTNLACTTSVITTVDSTGSVGNYTSLALGADGFARISYLDNTNADLKFARCTDIDCTGSVITTVDSTGSVGNYTSLALGADGFARISYYDNSNDNLKFVLCSDSDCTSKTITTVDSTGNVGEYTSLALGADGFARISYRDATNTDIKFAQCTNSDCSSKNITTVDTASGAHTSVVIAPDGYARIFSGTRNFIRCTNDACTAKTSTALASSSGSYNSMALGDDGLVRVVFGDPSLKLVRCLDQDCSSSYTTTLDDSGTAVGRDTSTVIGADGLQYISYYHVNDADLKMRVVDADGGLGLLEGISLGGENEYFKDLYVHQAYFSQIKLDAAVDSHELVYIKDSQGNYLLRADSVDDIISVADIKPVTASMPMVNNVIADPADPATVMVTGTDGFARILYNQDGTALRYIRCTNQDCTEKIDTPLDFSRHNYSIGNLNWASMVIGSDGFARIFYYAGFGGSSPTFIQCTNSDCTSKVLNSVSVNFMLSTSMAFGADGLPRIAGHYQSQNDLLFVRCTTASCTSTVVTTVESTGNVGEDVSLAMATDGFARISYYDATNDSVKLARCTNDNCSTSVITTVGAASAFGGDTNIAIGVDGFPRISFLESNGSSMRNLKFVQCADADCSSNTVNTVYTGGTSGSALSNMVLGGDGLAHMVFTGSSFGSIIYSHCNSDDCATSDQTMFYPPTSPTGQQRFGLALGPDGLARATIWEIANDGLRYIRFTSLSGEAVSGSSLGDTNNYFGDLFARHITTDQVLIQPVAESSSILQVAAPDGTTLLNVDGADLSLSVATLKPTEISGGLFATTVQDSTYSAGTVYLDLTMVSDTGARISYYDSINQDLILANCNSTCTNFYTLDSTGNVGEYSSIVTGSDNEPRISYYSASGGDLKFIQCLDTSCSNFAGPTTVDSTGNVGLYTSVAMGADGFARISYYDDTNDDLKFVQCTNDTCSSNVKTAVDSTGLVGLYTSVAMGADGFARISYYDDTNDDLKFVQCTNAACSTSVITTVDSTGNVGQYTSMVLGADGFARISYYDDTNDDLEYAQCTNADCSSRVITTIESSGTVGLYTSITLGADGFARISYFDDTDNGLRIVKCTNDSCSSFVSGGTVDSSNNIGYHTAIATANNGIFVAYLDATDGNVMLARDNWTLQTATSIGSSSEYFKELYVRKITTDQVEITSNFDSEEAFTVQGSRGEAITVDTTNMKVKVTDLRALTFNAEFESLAVDASSATSVGQYASVAIGDDGFARIAYYDVTNADLKFAQCTNADCSTSNITTVDSTGTVGRNTSVAIGDDGFARIAYYDVTNADLKFAQCTNADCSSNVITTIDSTSTVGQHTSIAIAADGFARISYYYSTGTDLKFVQCTNDACSTNVITTVDSSAAVGEDTSLALGADGFARISYRDNSNSDLKFAQCTNAACSTSNITTVDSVGDVGRYTSLALGDDGFARISYYDQDNSDLKFAQCTNAACSTSNISTVDSAGNVGTLGSIAIGTDGFARISYHDSSNVDLKFAKCTNAACSTSVLSTVDSAGSVGQYTALAISATGTAYVAYYDPSNGDLKLAQSGFELENGTSIGAADSYFRELFVRNVASDKATIQTTTNSATAFQIQNADGDSLLVADTVNNAIAIEGDLNITADSATALTIQNTSDEPLLVADASTMTVTVAKLVVSSTLTVNGHLISGNTSGTTTITLGAAAGDGAGGSVDITGNDTAGTIMITTTDANSTAGVLASVAFATSYDSTPHIVLTPQSATTADYGYFVTSGTSGFDLGTLGLPTSTTVIYSYVVIQ